MEPGRLDARLRKLYLSPRTVDMHVRNLLGKLGATNRVQAAAARSSRRPSRP